MTAAHTSGLLSMVDQVDGWNCDHDGVGSSCYSGIRIADTGEVIALAVAHTRDLSANPDCRPNARRIVACWNACDGLDVEFIEKVAPQRIANRLVEFSELVRQRDALLELVASFAQLFDEWEQIIPQDAREALRPLCGQAAALGMATI